MSWDEAILQVLREKQCAMHYRSIAKAIIEQKLRPEDKLGATPVITVNSYLRGDKLNNLVERTDRGVYILAEFMQDKMLVPKIKSENNNGVCDADEDEMGDALITAYGRFWDRRMWEKNGNHLHDICYMDPGDPTGRTGCPADSRRPVDWPVFSRRPGY